MLATLSDIFDKLLATRKIVLAREDRKSAEVLRTSLARKLAQYKTQMESVGYLDEEIAKCVISVEWKAPNTATYYLREPRRSTFVYQLVVTDSHEQQQAT